MLEVLFLPIFFGCCNFVCVVLLILLGFFIYKFDVAAQLIVDAEKKKIYIYIYIWAVIYISIFNPTLSSKDQIDMTLKKLETKLTFLFFIFWQPRDQINIIVTLVTKLIYGVKDKIKINFIVYP